MSLYKWNSIPWNFMPTLLHKLWNPENSVSGKTPNQGMRANYLLQSQDFTMQILNGMHVQKKLDIFTEIFEGFWHMLWFVSSPCNCPACSMCGVSTALPSVGTDDAVGGAASTRISNKSRKHEKRFMAGKIQKHNILIQHPFICKFLEHLFL